MGSSDLSGVWASLARSRGPATLTVFNAFRLESPCGVDPCTRMCELLVGLPEMNVLAVVDEVDEMLRVHVETVTHAPGVNAAGWWPRVKEPAWGWSWWFSPCFGRPTRLVWHKRRWSCLEETWETGSWTEENLVLGAARMAMSDRAGRSGHRAGRTLRPERERGGCRTRM